MYLNTVFKYNVFKYCPALAATNSSCNIQGLARFETVSFDGDILLSQLKIEKIQNSQIKKIFLLSSYFHFFKFLIETPIKYPENETKHTS